MTRPEIACPHCGSVLQPAPFVGTIIVTCPWCAGCMSMQTDGVSFEQSRVTAQKLVNGARVMPPAVAAIVDGPPLAPRPAPRVG